MASPLVVTVDALRSDLPQVRHAPMNRIRIIAKSSIARHVIS